MKKTLAILLVAIFTLSLVSISTPVSKPIENAKVKSNGEGPKYGGTFILAVATDPPHFNPLMTTANELHETSAMLYSSLLWLNVDFTLSPRLAERWEISPDGKKITFYLVRNATWHDGVPFTAKDVVYTVNKVWKNATICPWSPAYFSKIINATAIDDYTVVLYFKEPYLPLLLYLGTTQYCAILPEHIYNGTDVLTNPANLNPVGIGPFMLKEWVKGDHVTFVRNPNYYRKGLPYLNEVILKIMPDEVARHAAIEKGEVDAIEQVPDYQVAKWLDHPDIIVNWNFSAASGSTRILFVEINMRHPILGGFDERAIKVRKALYHTINKTWVVKNILFNLAVPATSPIPSSIKFAYKPGLPPYEYNITLANQLLDEAGYPIDPTTGYRFSLYAPYNAQSSTIKSFWEYWREELKKVGIELILEGVDRATDLAKWSAWDFDLIVETPYHGPDPSITTARFYLSTNIRHAPYVNNIGYNDSVTDSLFLQAQVETDPQKRKALFDQIQERLWSQVPMLWVAELKWWMAYRKDFAGIPDSPFGVCQSRETIWWKKGFEYSPDTIAAIIDEKETEIKAYASQFYDISEAMKQIEDARQALAEGKYQEAYTLAQQAVQLVKPPYWLYGTIAGVVIVVIAAGVYMWYRRRKMRGF